MATVEIGGRRVVTVEWALAQAVPGRFLGRGDLGWRLDGGRWLIAEMDGREVRDSPRAILADRRRQNDLVQVADVLRFTSADVFSGAVGSTVRRHLRLHAPHSPNARLWVV